MVTLYKYGDYLVKQYLMQNVPQSNKAVLCKYHDTNTSAPWYISKYCSISRSYLCKEAFTLWFLDDNI